MSDTADVTMCLRCGRRWRPGYECCIAPDTQEAKIATLKAALTRAEERAEAAERERDEARTLRDYADTAAEMSRNSYMRAISERDAALRDLATARAEAAKWCAERNAIVLEKWRAAEDVIAARAERDATTRFLESSREVADLYCAEWKRVCAALGCPPDPFPVGATDWEAPIRQIASLRATLTAQAWGWTAVATGVEERLKAEALYEGGRAVREDVRRCMAEADAAALRAEVERLEREKSYREHMPGTRGTLGAALAFPDGPLPTFEQIIERTKRTVADAAALRADLAAVKETARQYLAQGEAAHRDAAALRAAVAVLAGEWEAKAKRHEGDYDHWTQGFAAACVECAKALRALAAASAPQSAEGCAGCAKARRSTDPLLECAIHGTRAAAPAPQQMTEEP